MDDDATGGRAAELVGRLESPDRYVGESAAAELVNLGPAAVDALLAGLAPARPEEQPDAVRRRHELVIYALGQIGDQRATEPLLKLLEVPDRAVRAPALGALGPLRDPRAVWPLIALLAETRLAADALLGIGAPAVPPLLETLGAEDPRLRENAAFVLGQMGDLRAVGPLAARLAGIGRDAAAAAEALARLADPAAVDALLQALESRDWRARFQAARALGMAGDERAVLPLSRALRDPEKCVCRAAVQSLAQMGPAAAPAVQPLQELQRDLRRGLRRLTLSEQAGEVGDAIRRIVASCRKGATELISAPTPDGTGTELESSSPPEPPT